ncbi:MAG: hypothetical protein Fur0021_29400 [Candidatus Promineifilaceae bacterium]
MSDKAAATIACEGASHYSGGFVESGLFHSGQFYNKAWLNKKRPSGGTLGLAEIASKLIHLG